MNRSSALACLGLSDPVGPSAIQSAFRALAKTAHPDLNGTDIPLRRLILARDLLMRQLDSGPDMTEILEELSDLSEPLSITIDQALYGGPITADVPMPLELIHEAGPARSLMHRRILRFTLPAGLRDADRLRLKPGRPGGSGHLFRIEIRKQPDVYAAGNDLFLTVPTDERRLARGGRLRIETPAGPQEVDISAVSGPQRLRLPGLGLPATDKHPVGDLHITLEPQSSPVRPASELLADFHRKWA